VFFGAPGNRPIVAPGPSFMTSHELVRPKVFTAGYPHGYTLRFEIIGVGAEAVLIHSDGYYLDQNSNLRIFVRQSELRARLPELQLEHPYKIRATVTLSIGNGGASGYWSDEFLESIFPAHARSQSLTLESKF